MNQNNKKVSTKTMIILIIGIILVIIALLIGINSRNIDYEKYEKQEQKDIEKAKQNIKIEITDQLSDNRLLIAITNNNGEYVNSDFSLKYYDNSQTEVKTDDIMTTCIEPQTTIYVVSDPKIEYSGYKLAPETLQISLPETNLKEDSYCVSYKAMYKTNIKKDKNNSFLTVEFQNNTGKTIMAAGYLVFYKNNKKIAAEPVYFNKVLENGTAKDDVYVPYEKDGITKINYDKTEFILSQIIKTK